MPYQPLSGNSSPLVHDPNDTCHWKTKHTEHHDQFRAPERRTPMLTGRQAHMDTYLWNSIAGAYLKRLADAERSALDAMPFESEYGEKYHNVALDHSKPDEVLQNTYPLYGTAAITYWCPTAMNKAPFKRVYCLSKPNSECYDQQFR